MDDDNLSSPDELRILCKQLMKLTIDNIKMYELLSNQYEILSKNKILDKYCLDDVLNLQKRLLELNTDQL